MPRVTCVGLPEADYSWLSLGPRRCPFADSARLQKFMEVLRFCASGIEKNMDTSETLLPLSFSNIA